MDFDKSIAVGAAHILKGKRGDVMYPNSRTNLPLQVRDSCNHVCIKIHLYIFKS